MNPIELSLFGVDYGLDSSDICSEVRYFWVYPYNYLHFDKNELQQVRPFPITYLHDSTTFGELLEEFAQICDIFQKGKRYYFTSSKGYRLHTNTTVASIAKIMKRTNIDGLVLFLSSQNLKYNQKGEQEQSSDEQYEDECALQEMSSESSKREPPYRINFNFDIGNDNIVTIKLSETDLVKSTLQLANKLIQEINMIFSSNLNADNIKKFQIEEKGVTKEIPIDNSLIEVNNSMVNWTTIKVTFDQQPHLKKKITHPQNKIIIFKENSEEYITEIFEAIEFMTFKNIYKKKLAAKEPEGTRHKVSLKVMDLLIREEENLSKLQKFYQTAQQGRDIITLVGRVVSEKMYFYKAMSSLSALPEESFKIEDHICSKNKNEESNQFRQRIRQKIQVRAAGSKLQYFKNVKNVEPIYLYTCEDVHHIDQINKKSLPVYNTVNQHLREDQIFWMEGQHFQNDWKYRFTQTLINQLNKIEPLQNITVYRGISYDPKVKVGQIMTFRSFTSTSTSKAIACSFATSNTLKILLEIDIKRGRPIKQYSDFVNEDQVLLEPFTQCKVVSITENFEGKKIRRIKLKQLEDEQSPSEYPKSIANFVIWVDDKKFQGQKIYSNISGFKDPTILVQLTSTQQMIQWLSQEKIRKVFHDKSANIAFITNMTRAGNPMAGVEGVIELQKFECHMDIPIMFYIWDKESALKKIAANKDKIKNVNKIAIGNFEWQIQSFLNSKLNINFDKK